MVQRDPAAHQEHSDIYVAIRDTFDAAKRQLEDYVRERRRDVKQHVPSPRGRVIRLFPSEGYGFLENQDGKEVYFHQNAVLNGRFDDLNVGSEVLFAEEAGDEGPQASTVEFIRSGGSQRAQAAV